MRKIKDSDLNCIFCKYYRDLDKCQDTVYDENWHCPTITNIYYKKMIKHFPFNIIFKIQVFIWEKRADKECKERSLNL